MACSFKTSVRTRLSRRLLTWDNYYTGESSNLPFSATFNCIVQTKKTAADVTFTCNTAEGGTGGLEGIFDIFSDALRAHGEKGAERPPEVEELRRMLEEM